MKNILSKIVILFVIVILAGGCRKAAFDAYYGAPSNLAAPIYQILQSKGNFKSLLTCIDKAGYKDILSTSGYWTFFAPNDSAFKVFLSSRSITDVSQLDSTTAKQIVTYSLVYNAFAKARLGDFQDATGWVANSAFKRRTAYYTGFYTDSTPSKGYYNNVNAPVVAFASNMNGNYRIGDNNNKYIPYLVSNYTTARSLTATDYNYFYPSSTYTGFNVADASVVNADIIAQNGYVHEIDKVVLPMQSIDQYLGSNPQYSEFKKLYDKYMVSYVLSSDATTRYQTLNGGNKSVYIKIFNAALAYSPNNENYLKLVDNDGQADGYTMVVPTNDVLLSYINSVLLEKYSSLDAMPSSIIIDFLNSHMWQTSVWPSKFAAANDFLAEPPTMNISKVVDKKILSNGFLYGTSEVQQANVFRSVYGKAYLDPKYQLMTRALDQNFKYTVILPGFRYALIMMSDSAIRAKGYDFNVNYNQWQYTAPGSTSTTISATINTNFQRILASHIVPVTTSEMNDLSGSGVIETLNGDYIKWNAGTLSSAGTVNNNYVVNTSGTKTAFNGRVYYADNLLIADTLTLGVRIGKLGSATSSSFNYFYQYLLNSPLYTTVTTTSAAIGSISGVNTGVYLTLFIPTNTAISQAVKDGMLPGNVTTGVPTFAPTVQTDINLVSNFILNHFLNKNTVVPDGKKAGAFETLYKKASGDAGTITVSSSVNAMQITDPYGRKSNVIIASSNNLANYCVIHLIDNYLKYSVN
jgi:uncharacterized surface protein with fasciclin (FAS1) repeats